jgi:hypothetical protein
MRAIAAVLIAGLVLGGYAAADSPHQTGSSSEGTQQSMDGDSVVFTGETESLRDQFVQYGLRPIGTSRSEIITSLGEPDSTTSDPITNRHAPGQTDSIFRLHYHGLAVTIYHVSEGPDYVSEVLDSDNRIALAGFGDFRRQRRPRRGAHHRARPAGLDGL